MSDVPAGEARPPNAEEQLRFLRSLQRLLDEGSFVASYKYALLHAIADICVSDGDDSGAALELSTSRIAERFIRLYWPQVAPFVAGDDQAILSQNTGRQAAVVRELAERHEAYQGSLGLLERDVDEWTRLLRSVERTVKVMPLWKLQTVGSERLDFLYESLDRGDTVRLEPGVAYCFRAFYPMVTEIVEGAWAHFVQRRNAGLLGRSVELRSFLFGPPRRTLAPHRRLLRELQDGRCFYCDGRVASGGEVDHFIPWRRYRLDLGHNLVLAHTGCNSSKSDLLAAEEHLSRWAHRSRVHADRLAVAFDERGILHDWPVTLRIARWAYGQVGKARGQVWVAAGQLRPLGEDWERLLAA